MDASTTRSPVARGSIDIETPSTPSTARAASQSRRAGGSPAGRTTLAEMTAVNARSEGRGLPTHVLQVSRAGRPRLDEPLGSIVHVGCVRRRSGAITGGAVWLPGSGSRLAPVDRRARDSPHSADMPRGV
ncbi:hypothetical protein CHO01_21400 [Cellulomonas hominis]|uniref:Uncharacterized protein n=1 Tax=Cellulomonas hominis TaxID=156981 RepID=A0A511FEJ7_9CELL|nr:hypothetical protein CHO01_21400 [Cellulomonas hominis]